MDSNHRTSEHSPAGVLATARDIRHNLSQVIEGKDDVLQTAVTVLLAGGHLLVEDVPGVGKTVLAKGLAKSISASTRRIQFTPDLLPSDITGVTVYDQARGQFDFRPGAVFANVVIGDEINRASPKTQSAMLEAMEEHQVTMDGQTHHLPEPFMVIATQNPIDMDGTFPLPEAQRDRFMAQVSMGYPSAEAELAMLEHHGTVDPLESLQPVTNAQTISAAIRTIAELYTSPVLKRYIVDLVSATRSHPGIKFGASPRASLQLLRASRAHAALEGRDHVLPEDVQAMATAVLAHRLVRARGSRESTEAIVGELVHRTAVPGARS